MNKSDFISEVATKSGLNPEKAKDAVEAVLDTITETLKGRDSVNFIGFGSFKTVETRARTTKLKGKTFDISASIAVKFKSGKILNSKVSN